MKKQAALFVLIAGILWGMIGIYVRILNQQGLQTMDIVAIRAVVTAVILAAVLFLADRKAPDRKSLLKIRMRDIWCFLGTGICSIVFFNFCYFRAMEMIHLSVAAVLLYTAPAFVLVMSAVLFKEKITGKKIAVLCATVIGCGLASGAAGAVGGVNAGGILYGLGSGFGYAIYSIFSRYAIEKGYHNLTITFYTFFFASFAAVPLADTKQIVSVCIKDIRMTGFCLLFGLLSTVIPYVLYTAGLSHMENSRASVIASVEPITAAVIGGIVYRETPDVYQTAGIVLVIGAVIVSNIQKKKLK